MENSVTAGFRLSAQQERVWAHQQLSDGGARAAVCTIAIEGAAEPLQLRNALERVTQRHEILRTVFHRQAGLKVPFQVIRDAVEPAWSMASSTGWESLPDGARQAQFDLESGPTLKAQLVQLSPDRSVLILSLPLLCADVRSLHNLVAELGAAYAGTTASEDPMQYADVVEWQNELLESDDTRAGRDFWRDSLRRLDLTESRDRFPSPLKTRPRLRVSFRGSAHFPWIPASCGNLKAFAKSRMLLRRIFCWRAGHCFSRG